MKILRIRLKNLNSLKGEHSVDLTAEPLASAGLFAITGPTGAGKSTLLDAVTLALYGKAARYGNESNPEHVMSRHCGECVAEVEFEVPSGRYRAVWERHRSRKKAEGPLQQPKRYIYDAAGQPLAQQIREAEQKIEELLGLNYERFLRSVLLAQGEFARFLKANANERAELLESLTGTEIYSRLSRLAFSEAGRREIELTAKEEGLGQIPILDDEARKNLETSILESDQERERLGKEIGEGADMLGKIANLEGSRRKEIEATAEQEQFEKERQEAEAELELLRRHRLTLPFAEDLARLDAAEKAASSAVDQEKQATENHVRARDQKHKTSRLLRSSIEAALKVEGQKGKDAQKVLQKAAQDAAEARSWLDEHRRDAILTDELADLVASLGELKSGRTSLAGEWSDWRSIASKVLADEASRLPESLNSTEIANLNAILDAFLVEAGRRVETLKADEKAAKEELRLRKDHLEKAKRLITLEAHRHSLKSDEPCPLCGALEHPYAEGAAPSPEISLLEVEVQKATKNLEAASKNARECSEKLDDLGTERGNINAGLAACDAHQKSTEKLLLPIGEQCPAPGEEDKLRKALQERERDFRKYTKAEDEAAKSKEAAERSAKSAAGEVGNLEKKFRELEVLPDDRAVIPIATKEFLPVPDAENAHADAVQDEKTKAAQAQDRCKDAKVASEKLAEIKVPLGTAVASSEFQTLEKLLAARMARETADKVENLESALKKRAHATEALLKQARQDVKTLLDEKVLEGDGAEAFKIRQGELKKSSDTLLEAQITHRNAIKTDDTNRKLRKDKGKELEEGRKNLAVWKQMRELIGSHDGSKFRRYAQAISLDILTRHANRHLEKLSDRYGICRDDEEVLNLQIEDRHQASTRRPMASLSGGESFLVSLALALGLSDLAGRTVRIDSLFIDEGFGSLDPETLEVAIASLESLRQNHKTVGVISHVGLLKERISTQIVVEKNAGGVSRIRIVPEETAV